MRLGEPVLLARGVAEGLGRVPDRRSGPVADHVGHLGRMPATVLVVDVLDGLLPPARLDVEVDVGRAVTLGGQEPLEQQAEADGVGLGDVEHIAHRRVGGRAPPLAQDPVLGAEPDDVPHHQEVTGEVEPLDQVELGVELLPGPRHPGGVPGPVATQTTLGHQLPEILHLGQPVRAGERGKLGGDQRQVEGTVLTEQRRPLHHPGVAGEAPGLLVTRAQVGACPRAEPALHLVERAPGPHRGQGGGQSTPGRSGVVDVVGGHQLDPAADGQIDQGVVASRVERSPVVPQLDRHVGRPEPVDQAVESQGGSRRTLPLQGPGHRALAAPGEHQPVGQLVVAGPAVEVGHGEAGGALLPRQLGLADDPGQGPVADRVSGQDQEVGAVGVGLAG